MIRALIDIGRSVKDLYPMPLVENPYPQSFLEKSKHPPKILVFNLVKEEDSYDINSHHLEDFDEKDWFKYLYRQPFTNKHPAYSLSFRFPSSISTIERRVEVFDRLNINLKISKKDLVEHIVRIRKELENEGKVDKNTPLLVVFQIERKWPGEISEFIDSLKKFLLEDVSKVSKKDEQKFWKIENKICHGCRKEKAVVYGGIGGLLKFYTVDKYGYAPELNPRLAWRQYALCEECIFNLERGKRTVDDFLTWKFYEKSFWILPVATGALKEILDRFKSFHDEQKGKAHSESFEFLEDRLLYEASLQEEAASYHFVFVKQEQQALRILLHIEEVLPSVLGQYVAIKRETEDNFNELIYEAFMPEHKFIFNFFTSKNLKEVKGKKPGFSDEDFYMLVDKVFRRSPINEGYLVSKAMSRIRKDMAGGGENFKVAVLEALLSLEFLLRWGILKRRIGGVEMSGLPYEDFFEKHGEFFNHPAKRALVLLGVLVQKFLIFQKSQRGSTPFLKVLKNLRLDQKDVKKIYTALQNKMNEYGIGHWWPKLREGASLYFVKAGDKWTLSPEEIGFYIAVGMALHSYPAFREKEEEV